MIERYSLPEMSKIWTDESRFKIMLEVELCIVEAQSKLGEVSKSAAEKIRKLAKINVEKIRKIEDKTNHDVVAFVLNISESLGPLAKYIHKGVTSSDILDTALSIQLKKSSGILINDLEKLLVIIKKKACLYKDMVCIGRTHGIHAEPTTFGLKLLLMYDELLRSLGRLKKIRDEVSVGKISGAVGTFSNISPLVEDYVCKKLGLRPAKISTQIILRDVHANFLNTLALIASSLERCAFEIRHLQRTEVLEVEEPFSRGQKGSSAMPHKRNPVICERICGMSRLMRGYAQASLENINLWHERDISHSSVERVSFPDATILLDYMLNKFIYVINGLIVYPNNMLVNLNKTHGLIFSQKVLVTLMNNGMIRPKAYDLVQRIALKSWHESLDFKNELLKDRQIMKYISKQEIENCFNLDYYLRNVDEIFKKVIGVKWKMR
ncbi:MAG: adenylosuccinate lyase [Candidatus Omnitrophota bacterium]